MVQDVYNNDADTPLNISEENEDEDIIELLSPDVMRVVSTDPVSPGNLSPPEPLVLYMFLFTFCVLIRIACRFWMIDDPYESQIGS